VVFCGVPRKQISAQLKITDRFISAANLMTIQITKKSRKVQAYPQGILSSILKYLDEQKNGDELFR